MSILKLLGKLLAIAGLFACTAYLILFLHHNYLNGIVNRGDDPERLHNQASLVSAQQKSIQWLIDNKHTLMQTHNAPLWKMMRELVELTKNPLLNNIVREYQTASRDIYRNYPLDFQVYGFGRTDYRTASYETTPYYGLLFVYGFSCDKDLAELDLVQKQKNLNFCRENYPFSPACKTHQIMGFQYLRDSDCENAKEFQEKIDLLASELHQQLYFDFRIVDVFIQRLLMLLETGHSDLIRPRWVDRLIENQNSDGGWDDFQPLLPLATSRSIGFGPKLVALAKPASNFHATVQGALVTTYLLNF